MMLRPASLYFILSIAACATEYAAAADSDQPRGVGPEYVEFYKDSSTFSCISHPSIQIPFSAVNDDYCDCPDGSDEPGTSACSHLSPFSPDFISNPGEPGVDRTPALPGFYCRNKGHNPSYIPFQRVNDGVCDHETCCDGSDEWAHAGGVQCENRCKEIGKEWKKLEEKRQRNHTAAVQTRKELVETAARLRKEVEGRVADLEVEVEASELKVKNLEGELNDISSSERRKATKKTKESKGKTVAEAAKHRIEGLRTALVDLRHQRDKEHSRLVELEGILSKFKDEYNPNFNDEGVKTAVSSWEDYSARLMEDNDENNAPSAEHLDELGQEDGEETGINWALLENEEEVETNFVHQVIAYLPPFMANSIKNKLTGLRDWCVANGILADNSNDSNETQPVKDARQRLKTAESDLKSARSQLKDRKKDLETDFGKDSVFRALKGSCVSKDSGEYTYEICWMEKAKQKPRKGGGATTMGNFAAISSVSVDESTSSGQIIPQERLALQYDKGQTCWNGPARSTTVILECGKADEILKVTEDEKCVYSMYVATPAVCEPSGDEKHDSGHKDEL